MLALSIVKYILLRVLDKLLSLDFVEEARFIAAGSRNAFLGRLARKLTTSKQVLPMMECLKLVQSGRSAEEKSSTLSHLQKKGN